MPASSELCSTFRSRYGQPTVALIAASQRGSNGAPNGSLCLIGHDSEVRLCELAENLHSPVNNR